jgi:hypothetical protein
MSMPNIRQLLMRHWRQITIYGALFIALTGLLALRLNTLLPGFNGREVQTYHASRNLRYIFHHPVNAPFTLLGRVATALQHGDHSLLYLRVTATGLGLITLAVFCGLLRYWHDTRTAVFGTLLFGTSSWFLHTARLGTSDVLMFGFFTLVACGVWLRATNSPFALLIALLISASLLYVPGMIWLVILGIILNWRILDSIFKQRLWIVTLGALGVVALLAPLGWDIYRTPSIAKALLNLPSSGWPMPLTVLRNFLDVPVRIFVYGRSNPATWLDHLPVLDIFSIVMFVLGGYIYVQHASLQRTKLFLIIFIVGSAVISLGGSASLTLLIPFVYLIVAAGVGYILRQWFTVFPRNPIAQAVGMGAMLVVVGLAVTYQTRQYFVAWPQNTATQAAFTAREPATSRPYLVQ